MGSNKQNNPRRLLTALLAVCISCLALVSVASADVTVAPPGEGAGQVSTPRGIAVDTETGRLYVADAGNRRIDAFDSDGNFELAWGWGVADGSQEQQTCGPDATPPTTACLPGIPGGGAGQFNGGPAGLYDIAVDNDPASASHHDVYTLDSASNSGFSTKPSETRVQKFDPEGNFLLTFGGGVVDGGAAGTGDLTAGSPTVGAVVTTEKAFRVGQRITGAGIPAGTVIAAIGKGSITLSQPASATGSGVALSVPEGPGNVPVNEVDTLHEIGTLIGGEISQGGNLSFTGPAPDGVTALTGAVGEGLLHSESTSVTEVTTSRGVFMPGEEVSCCGGRGPSRPFATAEYLITAFDPATGSMTLSTPTNPIVPNSEVELEAILPRNSSAAFVQGALEALPNLSPGDIAVSGPDGGPYAIEFKGPRYGDTNVSGISGATSTARQGASGAEICTAGNDWSCSAGVEGTGDGQFAVAAQLAVGRGGTVYVADSIPVARNRFENRVQTFTPGGVVVDELALPESTEPLAGLAVAEAGRLYLTNRGESLIREYDASGASRATYAAPQASALAAGTAGELFSLENEVGGGGSSFAEHPDITQRDSAGAVVRRFGYSELKGAGEWERIAPYASAGGDIYAVTGNSVVDLSFPEPGPILAPEACRAMPLGNTRVTLHGLVNPEGKSTTVHFEYVDQQSYEAEGFASPNTKVSPESEPIGSDFSLHDAAQRVAVLPETTYHCRIVASNEDQAGVTGEAGSFTTLEPFEVLATWAAAVGGDRVTLNASVNPLGSPVGGFFEYITEQRFQESGFGGAIRAPLAPDELDFGAGESAKTASVEVTGLQPGTAYRYRLGVNAHVIPVRFGEAGRFRTREPGVGEVPDERRDELVSPIDKGGAEVATPTPAGGEGSILASAPSGEAVTFGSFTAFAGPEGAPTPSQYLSRRGPDGWTTKSVNLPGGATARYSPRYQGFTPDLGFGAALGYEPSLTADCPSGFENLYWRNTSSGQISCVTDAVPLGPGKFCPVFSGASADHGQVFFAANASFDGAPKLRGFSLYRWAPGEGIRLLSVLPDGSAAQPRPATAFGNARYNEELCENQFASSNGDLHNAVSVDGQRAFWSYGGEYEGSRTPLFASDTASGQTVEVDAPQGTGGPGGEGQFLAAAKNGSSVLFSSPRQLTADASGGTDLYRYGFGEPAGEGLIDLTPKALTPGSEVAGVQGLAGASEDGSRAYFVATAVLTGAERNAGGELPQAGEPNLYLWQLGADLSFIATLTPGESTSWAANPAEHGARASADGMHLAFVSSAPLSDYDNTDPFSGERRPEVYLYDASNGRLSCASCNPTGEQPSGGAGLPGWRSGLEGPRYLSEDGSRLFFESADDLLSGDENGQPDVYEFERPGAGTCTTAIPSYEEAADGCLYLISGGTSDDASYLIDASSDGRDVFFATRQQLLVSDHDERYDVYDDRIDGFPPPAPPRPACEGEACRLPAPPAPIAGSTSTNSFNGPGNQKPRTCPKGKKLRKGKCVHKKHKAKHAKHKRAHHKHRRGGHKQRNAGKRKQNRRQGR